LYDFNTNQLALRWAGGRGEVNAASNEHAHGRHFFKRWHTASLHLPLPLSVEKSGDIVTTFHTLPLSATRKMDSNKKGKKKILIHIQLNYQKSEN